SSSNSMPRGIRRTNLRRRSNREMNSQNVRLFRYLIFMAKLLAPPQEGWGRDRSPVRACRSPGSAGPSRGRARAAPGEEITNYRGRKVHTRHIAISGKSAPGRRHRAREQLQVVARAVFGKNKTATSRTDRGSGKRQDKSGIRNRTPSIRTF